MIDVLKYVLLGLVQGITEVLPISSSAHLTIVSDILKVSDDSLTFEVFLHIASLIAIMIYLWKKFWILVKGFFRYIFKRDEESKIQFKYCIYIVLSTIPTVIFTLIFKDMINSVATTLWIIGILLVINAIMIFIFSKITGFRKIEEINYKDSLVIGIFQCLGVFPGISRSGSCLCGAFLRKIDKEIAADYAFIMFIPAVVGATVLELSNFGNLILDTSVLPLYLISFIVTAVTTYFAFKILLTIIKKGKLSYFSIYCFIVGISVIIYDLVK